jgi:hypothetical protein
MLSVIFVVTTLAGINNQAGPVSGSRDDGRDAHALLAKMKTSRDLLKSGTYRASGRLLTNRRSLGAQQPQSEVQIFSTFDLDKGLFRFDRTQDVIRQIGADSVPGLQIGKYVRTPELAITWINPWEHKDMALATAVGIHQPTIKPPMIIAPVDVRSFGLSLWDDFRAGTPFTACYEAWDKDSLIGVFPEANGIYRLRLERSGRRSAYVPHTIWIDEHLGFSPVRLSYIIPPAEPGLPDQLLSECQVRWKNEAGVWVPASLHFERRVRGHLNDFCALTFEWISVNRPIPSELFTADGLDVPVGTRVVDYRAAPPRHIGQVKGLAPPK